MNSHFGLYKYLFVPWVGIFLYSIISIFSGATGFSAYKQMEAEKERGKSNIENLIQINQNLLHNKNAILSDIDTISVHAKEQGFASRGEHFARIVGMSIPQRINGLPGQVINVALPMYTPDRYIKIFSLCAALTVLVCFGVYDFLRLVKER